MAGVLALATTAPAQQPTECICGGVPQLLKLDRVAQILGTGRTDVYERIAAGDLRAVVLPAANGGKGQRRVRSDDLRTYVDSLEALIEGASA